MDFPRIQLQARPDGARMDELVAKLSEHNRRAAPQLEMQDIFAQAEASDGELVGGVLAFSYGGWMFLDCLWVHEDLRGRGIGGILLGLAEGEARRRGCHGAHTDTFTFQALPFYARHGYEEFARLEGFDGGETRFYLKKLLQQQA